MGLCRSVYYSIHRFLLRYSAGVCHDLHLKTNMFLFQGSEIARKELLELQAVAAAVESSGQAKAEAQVGHVTIIPCLGQFCKYYMTIVVNNVVVF